MTFSPSASPQSLAAGRPSRPALLACLALALSLGTACSVNPPPRWQEGGAPLLIQPARWDRADNDPIEILPNGQVLEDGDPIMLVDRVGRVVDEDNEPIAILLPDGFVGGNDNQLLGRVGVSNAAPPNGAAAWVAILPDGNVVYYDSDGDQEADGRWVGCDGPARRTCTLITHMILVRHYQRQPRSGVSVGIGIGL